MTAVTAGAQARFRGGRRVHVVQAEQGRADHGRHVDDAHPGLGRGLGELTADAVHQQRVPRS